MERLTNPADAVEVTEENFGELLIEGLAEALAIARGEAGPSPWTRFTNRGGGMGAWGAGSFENDGALDFLAELREEGLPAAGGALAMIKEMADDYLEAPESSAAIAAAEVLAALRGRPAADLPENVSEWVAAHPGDPGDELIQLAREVVDAVSTSSELAELWGEVGDTEWRAGITDLRSRLG